MSPIYFYQIEMLHLLWVIPLLGAVFFYARYRRRQALERFINTMLWNRIPSSASPLRRRWKAALVLLALMAIVFGLTRPAWNPKPKTVERRGRDVVFLLDVSKSMLAEDLAPNRLERAKLAIKDCLDRLQGDRVGLAVFAGTTVVKCPLTLDYGFFRLLLEQISTDTISRGGTMIGDALRQTLELFFSDELDQHRDIILITDGEDQESFPVEAAKVVGQRGIRLLAIGLGDENEGRPIPITDETGRRSFVEYEGQPVRTKLDADTLREMVKATPGGKYLNVATGTFDLGAIYQQLIASAETKEMESKTIEQYDEKFQIFLTLAILLLSLEMVIPERKKR